MAQWLPRERTAQEVLEGWLADARVRRNITAHRVIEARPAQVQPFPDDMHPDLASLLERRGARGLWSHQVEAWRAVRAGKHVVVATPTASGKSLCYHLPVLQRILEKPSTRALYLFPTKALAQDQYASLRAMLDELGYPVGAFTYDGDTPADARTAVRDRGHIVLSNPDMLHQGILPHHTRWLQFFENLEYVVIDEIHTYRGIFGSQVANVLRRLRRVAAFHGSRPRFLCASATIANPRELAEALVEEPVELVERSGAPRGERHVVFYNPPIVNAELGIRRSAIKVAKQLAVDLLVARVPTIVFATSRLHVEILLKYVREALAKHHLDPNLVQGYRGGYLPSVRRRIERGLRSGEVLGVIATNALELGVDIGQLDACISAGYPGTVASLWQQAGRAGRRDGTALTVFVARSTPLDQYIVEHPEYFFARNPEHARIQPDNVLIAAEHIKCATYELPFAQGEGFGRMPADLVGRILDFLASHRVVHQGGERYHWMSDAFPAGGVHLRAIPGENFVVIDVDKDRAIAEVDFRSTPTTLHEHAIYNLDGAQYQVERLDWDNHKAYVRRVEPDYFTDAMTYSRVEILDIEGAAKAGDTAVEHGEVAVTERVSGFKKVRFHTGDNLGYGEVNLPEWTVHTTACWTTLPRALLERLELERAEAIDALLGISHALVTVSAVHLMCDPRDIGRAVGDRLGRWAVELPQSGAGARVRGAAREHEDSGEIFDPTLFLFDRYPGGTGLAEAIFEDHRLLLERARDLIGRCTCSGGCPSCVGPLLAAGARSREVPLRLLDHLLSR